MSNKKKTTDEAETIVKLKNKNFKFIKWTNGKYENAYSKMQMHCEKHGDWSVRYHDYVNGGKACPKCGKIKRALARRMSKDVAEEKIKTMLNGYEFHGWENETFTGWACIGHFSCEKGHVFKSTYNNFTQGKRCPTCSAQRVSESNRQEENEAVEKMKQSRPDMKFITWVNGKYENAKSIGFFECENGHYVKMSYNTVQQGGGCKFCAKTGFKGLKTGYLYCLRSEDGTKVKVGITNDPETRMYTLKRSTPFNFNLIEMIKFEKGEQARNLEMIFHKKFESANLTGFDGSTEWLNWNPDIQTWFKLLSGVAK